MRRRTPDVEAFRSALAHELVAVSPGPGGWERVRDALQQPVAARRPRRLLWLLLAGPLVAGALLAGVLAAGAASTRPLPGQAVVAPPVVAVCAALAAMAWPGEESRAGERPVRVRPA